MKTMFFSNMSKSQRLTLTFFPTIIVVELNAIKEGKITKYDDDNDSGYDDDKDSGNMIM